MKSLLACRTFEDLLGLAPQLGVTVTASQFVRISGNDVIVTTEDGPKEILELRLALKEVKLKVAETRLIKKSILEFKRQRQAEYTS